MTKPTPGEWLCAPRSSVVGMPIVAAGTGRSIANVTTIHPASYNSSEEEIAAFNAESEANARLIVAAKALLEACQNFVAYMDNDEFEGDFNDEDKLMNDMRAAIAKAKGEVK